MIEEVDFRRESARILASLVRAFGPGNLSVAEDAVQEAFLRALRTWPTQGVPPNPSAWLHLSAKRAAIDVFRRERGEELPSDIGSTSSYSFDGLADDELRMLLMCCHPALSVESQIALTLRTVAGLSVAEIARALFVSEEAIQQRIVRAKRSVATLSFDLGPEDIWERLPSAFRVLYLLFNEGYSAHQGASLTRDDLCDEAILIMRRLIDHPSAARPNGFALFALMLLHSSRLGARIDSNGSLCLLADQDRTKWDRDRIRAGLHWLTMAATGNAITSYHAEAAIAAAHAVAPTYAETDWAAVLRHYDDLVKVQPSGVVRLNRAVAVAMCHGFAAGLREVEHLASEPKLANYYLLPATRADFLTRLGRPAEAQVAYQEALKLAGTEPERRFIEHRMKDLVLNLPTSP